jgi:hypothetical protein
MQLQPRRVVTLFEFAAAVRLAMMHPETDLAVPAARSHRRPLRHASDADRDMH